MLSKARVQVLAERVAGRRRESKDKSTAEFFRLIDEAVRGEGITNPSNARSWFKAIQKECANRSGVHRSAVAARRHPARRSAE